MSIASRDDVTVWDYSDYEAGEVVRLFAEKRQLATKIITDQTIQPGDTIIFDSVTAFYQMALQYSVEQGFGKSREFTPSLPMPGLSAYGGRTQYLIAAMTSVLKATRKRGVHCWFIAHEDTPTKDKEGNIITISLLMSDNAINQSSPMISEIWWLYDNNGKRMLAIRPVRNHQPMGSRMFRTDGLAEFPLRYDPEKPDEAQPHSIATWWKNYTEHGMKKLDVPK